MNNHDITSFIGRKKELRIFLQWLRDSSGPWIFYVHDKLKEKTSKGGIGKTSLLKKCIAHLKEQFVSVAVAQIDFFNVADRDGVMIARRIVQSVQQLYPDWSPQASLAALDEWQTTMTDGKGDATSIRERLFAALATDLQAIHSRMVTTESYLLLVCDTFELIEQNPLIALLRSDQTFPERYQYERIRVLIAGRNALDWSNPNWHGRKDEVKSVALSPFTQSEMLQYLTEQCDAYTINELPADMLQQLYEQSQGRPILLGLMADVLNQRVTTLDRLIAAPKVNFEAYLVVQINELDSPLSWAILCMAHLYHRFNDTLLEMILSNPDLSTVVPQITYQKLAATLSTLSFVRQIGTSGEFVLHDEMQRLVTLHCWNKQDRNHLIRQALSRIAISYYEKLLEQIQRDELYRSYTVEMLYHRLFLDVEQGLAFFEHYFAEAINLWMPAFANSLLKEVVVFESQMSAEQQVRLQFARARLLRREEKPTQALKFYQALSLRKEELWFERYRDELLYQQGNCYLEMNKFHEAIRNLESYLKSARLNEDPLRRAETLGLIGYGYRHQGKLNDALHYYNESLAAQKDLHNQQEYANILNSIGNVYRLQGKIDEALQMCKFGLRIRREIFRGGKISEVHVGLSLSTIGQIYLEQEETSEAQAAFQEAFDIYNRNGYRKGIAATLNRFGQTQVARDNLDKALSFFERAYEVSLGSDVEALINSLNKKGRVLMALDRFEEAAPCFLHAIDLAKQSNDHYQQVENLVDLAQLNEHQNQPYTDLLEQTEQLAFKYSYNLIIGKIHKIYGDVQFKQLDYRGAFRHYRIVCRYMALHGKMPFKKFLQTMTDILLVMPTSAIPIALDLLTAYWSDLQLDEKYPELPRICKEVSKYIVI